MVCFCISSTAANSAILSATYKGQPEGTLQSVNTEYNDIPTAQLCSLLCTERSNAELSSACFSYSYNAVTQVCHLSSDMSSEIANETSVDAVFDIQGMWISFCCIYDSNTNGLTFLRE